MLMIDAFRLKPGDDLYTVLYDKAKSWPAAFVLSCVGSLSQVTMRLAEEQERLYQGPFEITSLVGTCCPDGLHLHICVANSVGQVLGGHLKAGSIIHTTAELVIGLSDNHRFFRHKDPATGWLELVVEEVSPANL